MQFMRLDEGGMSLAPQKFCVTGFRQKQEYHMYTVHNGLIPLA